MRKASIRVNYKKVTTCLQTNISKFLPHPPHPFLSFTSSACPGRSSFNFLVRISQTCQPTPSHPRPKVRSSPHRHVSTILWFVVLWAHFECAVLASADEEATVGGPTASRQRNAGCQSRWNLLKCFYGVFEERL